MLSESRFNPFDDQSTKAQQRNPAIAAMTQLNDAFTRSRIPEFEAVLRAHGDDIRGDDFMRGFVDDLLASLRSQVALEKIAPYARVRVAHVARELGVTPAEAEALVVGLVLDGRLLATLDQPSQVITVLRGRPAGGAGGAGGGAGGAAGGAGAGGAPSATAAAPAAAKAAAPPGGPGPAGASAAASASAQQAAQAALAQAGAAKRAAAQAGAMAFGGSAKYAELVSLAGKLGRLSQQLVAQGVAAGGQRIGAGGGRGGGGGGGAGFLYGGGGGGGGGGDEPWD